MRVAIVGASGYVGLELVRIVLRHPELELVAATSQKRAGMPVAQAFPGLRGLLDLDFEAADAGALAGRIDVAFTALPHGASAGIFSQGRHRVLPGMILLLSVLNLLTFLRGLNRSDEGHLVYATGH